MVIFQALTHNDLSKIVNLLLMNFQKRLEDKHIKLNISQAAIDHVLKIAYDPIYGARPLRRYLEKNLGTQISKMLITGELSNSTILNIDYITGDNLVYRIEPTKETQPVKKQRV